MKKYILTLLLLALTMPLYASEAKHAIRSSNKNMSNRSMVQHQVVVKKLTAALALPDITQSEKAEVLHRIQLHNDIIAKIKAETKPKVASNQTAGTKTDRPRVTQKEEEVVVLTPQPVKEPEKRNAVLKIKDIEFTNELRGDIISEAPFYASDMRYLYAQIYYDGPSDEVEKRVYVKLYDPNGNLKRFNDHEDYTFTQRVTFYPYDEMDSYLAGTGNSQKSIFLPGTYRYEVWIDGECALKKNVEISMRPGEASMGAASIKSITANPKNYSVGFDVTISAENMPDQQLITRISFKETATGKPVGMTTGGDVMVERAEQILYDEAVLSFSMNMPYSKFNLPKGWSGSITYTGEIIDPEGKVIATSQPGTFTFTQN